MEHYIRYIGEYLSFCREHKRLSEKSIKAYKIDLQQFSCYFVNHGDKTNVVSDYVASLHKQYAPKTAKRKLASLKAFAGYLREQKNMEENDFHHAKIKFREPQTLPKTIPVHTMQVLLTTIYQQSHDAKTQAQRRNGLRDIAIVELLLGTGIRISELCNLKQSDVDLIGGNLLIHGKGSKERILSMGNPTLLSALSNYATIPKVYTDYFFSRKNHRLSEQSVRQMLNKYRKEAKISQHITPHMFRHSFATLLLEQDVDIRYIQKLLGHSSISVTEIYTFVSSAKQREILQMKNPRNLITLNKTET